MNRAPSYQLVFVLEIAVSVLGVNLLDRVVGHRRDGAHRDQILVARPQDKPLQNSKYIQ